MIATAQTASVFHSSTCAAYQLFPLLSTVGAGGQLCPLLSLLARASPRERDPASRQPSGSAGDPGGEKRARSHSHPRLLASSRRSRLGQEKTRTTNNMSINKHKQELTTWTGARQATIHRRETESTLTLEFGCRDTIVLSGAPISTTDGTWARSSRFVEVMLRFDQAPATHLGANTILPCI